MNPKYQLCWDLPTRLIHWGIALAVGLNLFILEEGEDFHQWIGYTAVGLVFFRIIWGFLGSEASRFSNFPLKLSQIRSFLENKLRDDGMGHNPIASWVYFAIWTCILALGLTGWMMNWDRFWGEDWLQNTHEWIATVLMVAIGLHLLGLLFDRVLHQRNTWLGMITGKKFGK